MLEDSASEAQALIEPLSAVGYAVIAARVKSPVEFQVALKKQDWDLILSPPKLEGFAAKQALGLLKHAKRDIPFVIIAQHLKQEELSEALRSGAQAMIEKKDTEYYQLVVQRELRDLAHRRARHYYEHMFRESERRCQSLLETSRDAIVCVRKGKVIYANPVFGMLCKSAGMGDGMTDISAIVHADDRQPLVALLKRVSGGIESAESASLRISGKGGKAFPATVQAMVAHINGQRCVQLAIPVGSEKSEPGGAQATAERDGITGLYSQSHFLDELNSRTKAQTAYALAYLEIDDYTALRKKIGAGNCDLVVRDIAELLQAQLGEDAIAARYGDHIITALLQISNAEQVQALTEQLCAAVAEHEFDINGKSMHITCSIGIGTSRKNAKGSDVLSWADAACQAAKQAGGKQVRAADPDAEMQAKEDAHLAARQRLRAALAEDRFRLVFQPIVNLHAQPAENYEVLIRMLDEQGTELMPGDFLPAAEQAGMMPAIDRWVIDNAIKSLAERRTDGNETSFLVKLSEDSLSDETLAPWLAKQLQERRLAGDGLIFELRENVAVSRLDVTQRLFGQLKQMRCRTALGHFGADAKSIEYLEKLRVDFVKLAPQFIDKLNGDQQSEAAVKVLVQSAHDLGTLTIACFVQEASKLSLLWNCAVDYIQGYFLQAPEQKLSYDFDENE